MKKIYRDRITNIEGTDSFDSTFLLSCSSGELASVDDIEVIYMSDLLEKKKNIELLEKVKEKPAMYSNVYSPKDELEIFTELFEKAVSEKKKIHIVGITLKEEVEMIEKYYRELGFLREDVNCFEPDFGVTFVTVSVKIENLMWKGSDYKAMRDEIFFNPPIRESGQVKGMYKGINRGIIAGLYIGNLDDRAKDFLSKCVGEEKILIQTLAKILSFNYADLGLQSEQVDLKIRY